MRRIGRREFITAAAAAGLAMPAVRIVRVQQLVVQQPNDSAPALDLEQPSLDEVPSDEPPPTDLPDEETTPPTACAEAG